MEIEALIFKKSKPNYNKLKKYGFGFKDNYYFFTKKILDDAFEVRISISNNEITGKVFDLDSGEEYSNFRFENLGSFASKVKEEYENILIDIKNHCFEESFFTFPQANRICEYIKNKYQIFPEFLWEKFPQYSVFRNNSNNKWFALIANIKNAKISSDEVEIINVKVEEEKLKLLLNQNGFFEAYHMDKKNWVTIVLNDTMSDQTIIDLIDNSYNLINESEEWIIPANATYFDVINYFDTNEIVDWKQSSNIKKNDIIYVYLSAPYSCILYKCIATCVDIPYEYQDKNVKMEYIMKLKVLKKYKENEISFKKLNDLGIKAIRGPRKINKNISNHF